MVDYNKQVKDAIKLIDILASKGKFSQDDISFVVMRELGFGENFTKKYLKKCLERKFFSMDENGIISSKKEEETKDVS